MYLFAFLGRWMLESRGGHHSALILTLIITLLLYVGSIRVTVIPIPVLPVMSLCHFLIRRHLDIFDVFFFL